MNSEWLPDLYRYRKTELPKQKLILGGSIVTVICLITYLVNAKTDQQSTWLALLNSYFYIQAILWMIAAASQTSGAISSERTERTWDFQRLTPLTSLQTAVGKILGAPIFTLTLGALVIPWALLAALGMGGSGASLFLMNEVTLIGLAFLCNSMGLLISSLNSLSGRRGSIAIAPIFAVIVLWVYAVGTAIRYNEFQVPDVNFYSVAINATTFFTISAYVFGAWAFMAAKWQIGRDYLEPQRAWRNPAFLVFMAVYFGGIEKSFLLYKGLSVLLFIIYAQIAAAPDEEELTLRAWIKRFKEFGSRAMNEAPTAMTAWTAFAAIVIVTCSIHRFFDPLTLAIFALRDISILETSRFLKFKQSRLLMGIVVILIYVIPFVLVKVAPSVLIFAMPMAWLPESAGLGHDGVLATNAFFGLVQAAGAMSCLMLLERNRHVVRST